MTQRGPARTFTDQELSDLLRDVTDAQAAKRTGAQPPEVIRAAFMLSFYAGLRVQEIAGLQWNLNVFQGDDVFRTTSSPVYDDNGKPVIKGGKMVKREICMLYIHEDIGKYGKSRTIPMRQSLVDALLELRALGLPGEFVIPSGKDGAHQGTRHRAHALKMRMNRLYQALGIDRATSHSGRRSFITKAARNAEAFDTSFLDVRDLAGHASINTTQNYVDPSPRQADLVDGIWAE